MQHASLHRQRLDRGHDVTTLVDGNDKIVDREGDLLWSTAKHQVVGGENVVQSRDVRRLRFASGPDEQILMPSGHQSTCSSTSRPRASSSRVVTSGGSNRTVQSPAVQ